MDTSSLLPRDKYEEVARKFGRGPIILEIENERQSLFYFGANHSRNPADPQYQTLRECWQKFLKKTENRDRIVLVEGRLRQLVEDEEKAIVAGAEGSLITLFAHKANVPVSCPDLSDEELMNRLSNIPKQEFLLYRFLGYVHNFQTHADPKPDFEKSVENWFAGQKGRELWRDTDVSFSAMKSLYKKVLGKEFNENENQNGFLNPNKNETSVNYIARSQSDLRDFNIASKIEHYWNEGKSIFVVFGKGHLIIEEPALKKLLR